MRRLARREGKWGRSGNGSQPRQVSRQSSPISASNNPRPLFEQLDNRDSYPRLNAQDEKKLGEALLLLADLSPEASKKRISELNEEHTVRRETVWARRGEAPLAQALVFIAKVAAAKPLPSHDGNALAEEYVAAGAEIDWAAMCALAAAPRELDREAISAALRAVYLPLGGSGSGVAPRTHPDWQGEARRSSRRRTGSHHDPVCGWLANGSRARAGSPA